MAFGRLVTVFVAVPFSPAIFVAVAVILIGPSGGAKNPPGSEKCRVVPEPVKSRGNDRGGRLADSGGRRNATLTATGETSPSPVTVPAISSLAPMIFPGISTVMPLTG